MVILEKGRSPLSAPGYSQTHHCWCGQAIEVRHSGKGLRISYRVDGKGKKRCSRCGNWLFLSDLTRLLPGAKPPALQCLQCAGNGRRAVWDGGAHIGDRLCEACDGLGVELATVLVGGPDALATR